MEQERSFSESSGQPESQGDIVDPDALVLSFVKHKGLTGMDRARSQATQLVCLHHYDEIAIHTNLREVASITKELKSPLPEAVTVRRILGFRLYKDASPGFRLDCPFPVVSIFLFRLNRRLDGHPTLAIESHTIAVLAKLLGAEMPSQEWGIYRTFAKKELILVLQGRSLLLSERLHLTLEEAEIEVDKETVPVFEMVESWPCVSQKLWSAFNCELPVDQETQSVLAEDVHTFRAMRVTGGCRHQSLDRHRCVKNLDSHVRGAMGDGGKHLARPITGIVFEKEVDRPKTTFGELLRDIQLLRNACQRPDSCCSVYLVRGKQLVRGKLADTSIPVGLVPLRSDWKEGLLARKEGEDFQELYLEKPETWSDAITSLDSIRKQPGGFFIGLHLEEGRDRLMHALNNPMVASEFEDLIPLIGILENLAHDFENSEKRNEKDPAVWSILRAQAQVLANYMEHAIKERQREDVCGQSHHVQFAPLSASGFSRVAPVGSYSVMRTLRTLGMEKSCLCVNGYVPVYRELGAVPILNSDLRSTLEPFYHFGLGHEAGHIVNGFMDPVERKYIAEALGDPDYRKFFSEFLADAFCYYTTFSGNVDAYLQAWVPYYFNLLEYDLEPYVFINASNAGSGAKVYDRISQYVARLLMTSFLSGLDHHCEAQALWKQATERVRNVVYREKMDRKLSSTVSERIVHDAIELAECADRLDPQGRYPADFFKDFEFACKEVQNHIQLAKEALELDYQAKVESCAQAWQRGQVFASEIEFPLAALVKLGSSEKHDFSRNVAAMLSIFHWDEMDRLKSGGDKSRKP